MDYSSLNVELIGDIYERVLGTDLFEVDGEICFEVQKAEKSTRAHQTGATYTVVEVVKKLIDDTITTVQDDLPTVIDPACGSGHFLVRALRRIDTLRRPVASDLSIAAFRRRIIVEQSIFGVDINPWAARLTRLMLAIETAHPSSPAYDSRKNIIVLYPS